MTDERRGPEEENAGVFGNLPRTRPGSRSPRRDAARASSRSGPAREPAPESPEDAERAGTPLEDIAWAGVAAAAEAATLGVRLANRALDGLREAIDRR